MSFLLYAKKNLINLPYSIGAPLAKLPYQYRPGMGGLYKSRAEEIRALTQLSEKELKDFIFQRVKDISVYSYKRIPFYADLYRASNVNPERLSTFDDLKELPIIVKRDLQNVDLSYRSNPSSNSSIVNTGGSTGKPLDFYIEPSSIPHEWAHMHTIWGTLGFKQSDLRIVFAGRSDIEDVIVYDSARHQFNVDLYSDWSIIANKLLTLYAKYTPRYLHGYPSAIFDFIAWLNDNEHPLLSILKNNIRGMFLGSEFPSPQARDRTENILGCKSVSWYGHTERSTLAYEDGVKNKYRPFHSYGLSEGVWSDGICNLVSTSYYNFSSPLIRYNTEDIIKPTTYSGLLTSFEISQGRSGEFVIDLHGNKVFLTALIFGRHHKLFDISNHIQVEQVNVGVIKIYYVLRKGMKCTDPENLFDKNNLHFSILFEELKSPVTTISGKVPLLIKW